MMTYLHTKLQNVQYQRLLNPLEVSIQLFSDHSVSMVFLCHFHQRYGIHLVMAFDHDQPRTWHLLIKIHLINKINLNVYFLNSNLELHHRNWSWEWVESEHQQWQYYLIVQHEFLLILQSSVASGTLDSFQS